MKQDAIEKVSVRFSLQYIQFCHTRPSSDSLKMRVSSALLNMSVYIQNTCTDTENPMTSISHDSTDGKVNS